MKKFAATLLVAGGLLSVLVLPIFASAQTVAQVNNDQSQITSMETSLQTLESENASATNNYESIQADISSIQAEINQDQVLNNESGSNPQIQAELNTARTEVDNLAVKAANLYNTVRLQVAVGIDKIELQALQLEAALKQQ